MKFITAFFMAWGNFITFPCPLKKWDNNLKNLMLAFLPAVGAVVGVLWMVLFVVLRSLNAPVSLASLVMVFYIFAICGFMHMDGYMDCMDAILSRRPLEDRQRILKDSNVGAFAVVTLVFLVLAWYAAMSIALPVSDQISFLLIPVISRGMAGSFVLSYKPIGHSQYVEDYKQPNRGKYHAVVLVQMAVIVTIAVVFTYMYSASVLGAGVKTGLINMAILIIVQAIASLIACAYARKQLGGMSGDIAGYTICFSELAGIFTLALTQYYTAMFVMPI